MLKKPKDQIVLPALNLNNYSPMKTQAPKKRKRAYSTLADDDESWLDSIAQDYGMPFDSATAASLMKIGFSTAPVLTRENKNLKF